MPTFTGNYNFNLPTVSGDVDTWGDLINANWETLDDTLFNNFAKLAAAQTFTENQTINAGLVVGAPTNGHVGTGIINAQKFYFNGIEVPYEEGDIAAPIVYGSTSAGAGTYTSQTGKYVRVGKTVSFHMRLGWSAHTGTGSLNISGLPFVSSGGGLVAATILAASLTVGAGKYPAALIINGTDDIYLYELPTGGGSAVRVAIDSSADLYIAGSYHIA